jgi:hypothetical protein
MNASEAAGMIGAVDAKRRELIDKLRSHYRSSGWKVSIAEDGMVEAVGPHGVKWMGRAVIREDLDDQGFEAQVIDLAERRMPGGGELCPLDLLPAEDCAAELRALLERTGLDRNTHISVYSLAAA